MPEEETTGTDLDKLLDYVEDYALHGGDYQSIQIALAKNDNIPTHAMEKLIALSICDITKDLKNSVNKLNVLLTLLKKIKTLQLSPIPDLVPSAVAVLQNLKTSAQFTKVEALRTLCFKIMMSYPDETLIFLVVNHSMDIMDMLNVYWQQQIPFDTRVLPIHFLTNLLKILPPDRKATFVKEGMNFWFSKLIPTVSSNSATIAVGLEALELITDDLVHIDYSDNPNWRVVLQNIYTPQKYPSFIKGLLEVGNAIWHRLWIVYIKLLKSQITKSTNSIGSPINSMLPVVELAFKLDLTNRCRAFTCWNVLIDNFSTETNEVYINKRVKLLIIPLLSNNAKFEETALAKLKTWWHLITCFYPHLDKLSDIILMPFLYFCFGKSVSKPDKPVLVPGMLTEKTKVQCVQAFINTFGHLHCDGCVNLPKLKGKLISSKLLVSHWRDWIHAIKSAIVICTDSNQFSEQQIKCLWKCFIMTVGELPENNIRRDLFNEVLALLEKLAEDCNDKLADIILNVLIVVLFEKDEKISPLLKSKDEANTPINKIVKVIMKLPLSKSENRHLVVQNFKILSTFLIEDAFKTSSLTIECILKHMTLNCSLLWIALADTISELLYTSCPRMLCKMILWPLNNIDKYIDENLLTTTWFNMYKCVYCALHSSTINEDIIKILSESNSNQSTNFMLEVAITILHKKLSEEAGSDVTKEVTFLKDRVCKINNINDIRDLLSSLFESIVLTLNNLCKNVNVTVFKDILKIISYLLDLFIKNSNKIAMDDLNKLGSLFKALESNFKVESYSNLKIKLLDKLNCYASQLQKLKSLKESILNIYENELSIEGNTKNGIQELIKALETDKINTNTEVSDQSSKKVDFSIPNSKPVTKKQKKKEANIVDTVTEAGEEFVVVKSNWKFNPKKLTDNQKEKLQRKREDIPALYQDLSQSQDEFKLNTWKTDSQDTSATSKSTSEQGKEDVTAILKNIPNVEFASKILENIKGSDKVDNIQVTSANENLMAKAEKKNENKTQSVAKDTKSPRIALKDRVFRNVRNLIEKSNINDGKDLNSTIAENGLKTPTGKGNPSVNVINSAPSLICTDRPSRVKRKPKKFDDLEILGLKKRRNSNNQNNSPTDSEIIDSNSPHNILHKPSKVQEINEEKDLIDTTIEVTKITDVPEQTNICDIEVISETEKNEENKNDIICEENILTVNDSSQTQTEDKTNDEMKKLVTPIKDKLNETHCENDNKDKALVTDNKIGNKNKLLDGQKSTGKKSTTKKSRIEKELAIDMVEGHPFLQVQSEKRLTRKAILNSPCTRKNLFQKLNKSKTETKSIPKSDKKLKDKEKSISIKETQNTSNEEMPESQDIIESSQESTITTISVKSSKSIGKKAPLVISHDFKENKKSETQNLLDDDFANDKDISNTETKDDIELPRNKTVEEKVLIDLTENMDTETINEDDVIIINDDEDQNVAAISDNMTVDTQNTAEAETQSLDPSIFINEGQEDIPEKVPNSITLETNASIENPTENIADDDITNASLTATPNDVTATMTESALATADKEDLNSPFNDEEQRKKDFLNNTLEISPIKIQSPVREKKSPSPETSSDYVVIKLSSPVQSNGEPFEKIDSPEIFTEDKVSPDKRDQSPPREEVSVTNTSPSSSLSLKKNRPQVRSGGRAAQMVGLCVPNRLQTIMISDKTDSDDRKKSPSLNSSARRNLRILYNTPAAETPENSDEQDTNSENFLKLKRNLPTTDCSPSGPILKRKLADITDEATASPASKRKRVSFHDPPVSTTICVKKYIEPCGLRSPQNSAIKRQERQLRSQLPIKSPKRLDNVFKLDSILTKTVESFTEINSSGNTNDDTEMSSIEQTPVVQVVKTTDLNDSEPICPELIACTDPISNIAGELSSPAMKVLLIKEFNGKIDTISDLAKMTELEINRLCIRAPKVEVAKKVLNEYSKKIKDITPTMEEALSESLTESKLSVEVQTNIVISSDVEMQTNELDISSNSTQTDLETSHCSVQTDESGSRTTADIVASCLTERKDFVDQLCEKIDENSKKKIVDTMPFEALTDLLMNKLTTSNSDCILNRIVEERSKLHKPNDNDSRLSTIQDYICERFESKNIVLFCSELLKRVYDNK